MARYYVTITEVITNWNRIEMEAESPEALEHRIVEEGDYDPDSLQPQTVEVLATDIELVADSVADDESTTKSRPGRPLAHSAPPTSRIVERRLPLLLISNGT